MPDPRRGPGANTRGEVRREPGAAPPSTGRERQGRPVTLYLTPVSGDVCPGDPPEGAGGAVALGGSGPGVIAAAASAESRRCPGLSLSPRPAEKIEPRTNF